MTPDEAIASYRSAFRLRHKKTAPRLTYERGYYVFHYDGYVVRKRRGMLLKMRDVLLRDASRNANT